MSFPFNFSMVILHVPLLRLLIYSWILVNRNLVWMQQERSLCQKLYVVCVLRTYIYYLLMVWFVIQIFNILTCVILCLQNYLLFIRYFCGYPWSHRSKGFPLEFYFPHIYRVYRGREVVLSLEFNFSWERATSKSGGHWVSARSPDTRIFIPAAFPSVLRHLVSVAKAIYSVLEV